MHAARSTRTTDSWDAALDRAATAAGRLEGIVAARRGDGTLRADATMADEDTAAGVAVLVGCLRHARDGHWKASRRSVASTANDAFTGVDAGLRWTGRSFEPGVALAMAEMRDAVRQLVELSRAPAGADADQTLLR